MTKHITMTAAQKEIGVTRHTLLKWEEALGFKAPREGEQQIRMFPALLVANLKALNTLLEDMEIGLGEWLMLEQRLRLNLPRDAWGMRDLSDPYWARYFKRLQADMAEATVDIDELLRWEWELHLSYPLDRMGNKHLTATLVGYLRAVQERYAEGWNTYDVLHGLKRPQDCAPEQHALALGPDM